MSYTLLSAKRCRTSQPGPFSAARSLLFCGIADSSIGERKSGALVRVLRKRVIRQEAESVGILAPHVHVAGVIPTLRRVLEQVDRAHGKSLALDNGVGIAAGRQHGAADKGKRLEGAPRSNRARSRRSIVDQVSALQVKTARSQIAYGQRTCCRRSSSPTGCSTAARIARRVGIECREAHRGCRQRAGSRAPVSRNSFRW